jgi:hypothetical protein
LDNIYEIKLNNKLKKIITMFLINKYQIKQTTNLLTDNYINIKFLNNKLNIISNPSNIDISKLLTKNFITFKTI